MPYDPATQTKAADELRALPVGSTLGRMMVDYAIMRAEARACRSAGR